MSYRIEKKFRVSISDQKLLKNELLNNGISELYPKRIIHSCYFDTTDFTIAIHDGPLAGQEIPHVHVHVIPRKQGDGGRALPAMFPNANPPNPPDFASLANLCNAIKEASE